MKWTAGVRREVLPNGLTLLVQVDVSAPVAGVVTHVRAGFFDEPDRWQGISHVLEHMFFKGTPTRGVGAVARETRAAGGYLNAHTAYDHTAYFVVLPSGRIADALDIQSDALLHPLIDPADLARELQVIIQEAKRKLDTPDAVAHETLHEVLFDRHRIRRWRIGHEAQLAGFTAHDVRGYYESRYVPGRTIIAIAGNVDPAAALELARRRYGDWPDRPGAVDPSPEEPPRSDIRARTLRGDVAQAELVLGWRGVPPLDPEAPGLELAAAVLSLGRGSWLYRALREPGIVTSIAAHHYAPTELGIFSVGAGLPADNIEPAVRGVAEAVARLSLIGPTEADLERARRLLLMRWARRMESMDGRASALASAEALDGFEALDREYAALEAASAADVRRAAARRLLPDAVAAVGYLPAGEGAEITSEMVAAAFAVTALTPLAPPSPANGATPHRARQPAAGRTTAQVLHVALDGADLLIRPKPGPPMVTLGIYAPRRRFDLRREAGIAALAMRGALRGADGLDAAALAFAFERLGGSLSSSLSTDWVGLGATVLAERVPEAALLLERIFSAPAHRGDAIEAERAVLIAEAEQAADDMFRYPMQLAFAAAFNDQAYGVPVAGLPDTLPDISAEAVRRWYGDTVTAARPVVIAVGDLDPERAAADLSAAFEVLPPRVGPPREGTVTMATGAEPRVMQREKAQSAFAMVFPGPPRSNPLRYTADVWAAVASGLGGRLFEALRDRRSLAYTVFATAWQRGRAGALVSYIATAPEREEEARVAMLKELARFGETPVSEAELSQATQYLAGQAQVRRQSGASVAGEILEAWMIGEGLDDLADPAARYLGVTAEAVQRLAADSLDPARRSEGVVRGSPAANQ